MHILYYVITYSARDFNPECVRVYMCIMEGFCSMYIKKWILITCSIVLVAVTAVGTIMAVNPFGALQFDDFSKLNTGVKVMKDVYYEDIENAALVDGALLGLAYSADDPYTVYMNAEEAKSFMEDIDSDDYTGVGLYITSNFEDNTVTVVSPLSDSPAEKAGIVSGDKILKINGEPITGENIDEVANRLKGKENTEVNVEILKKSTGEVKELTLVRAKIKRETVDSKMINSEVGYIRITQFGINTYDEFVHHFNSLVDKKMQSLVIDLRNNPGGYMEIAVEIADVFIDDGEIVYTLDKNKKKHPYEAKQGSIEIPIALLTNGGSASASEILVGALRDHSVAKSVGEKTFGKGVTQIPYEFKDGSILKITNSRYYTPNGVCIDKEGIVPDVEVKMSEEKSANISTLTFEEDDQLKMAVEVLVNGQ